MDKASWPTIGVGGIVFDAEGRVLLIRRGRPPAVGLWSVPGGKQEAGETLAQACRREIAEETGLFVSVGPIVAVVERSQEGFHYVIIDFLACLQMPGSPSPRPADDVVDARWVSLGDFGSLALVDGLEFVIQRAAAVRQLPAGKGLVDSDGRGSDFVAW